MSAAGKCNRCRRSLRPHGTTAADFPGTVRRQTATSCVSCHFAAARAALAVERQGLPETPTVMARLRAAAPVLHDYIAGRRRRKVPTTGLPWDEWPESMRLPGMVMPTE